VNTLATRIATACPDLAGQPFTVLGEGWDSVAVLCVGWVIKFPKSPLAAHGLQQECRVLAALRDHVRLPIPHMHLLPGPATRHRLLPGEHLLTAAYADLSDLARNRLAADLAGFYADLHAMPLAVMRTAGVTDAMHFGRPDDLAERLMPVMPAGIGQALQPILPVLSALGPDPYPPVFAFCDGHGWNMAFDHAAGRLNGIYDFADSGIAGLHRDFIYGSFISADLTVRTIAAYEAETGRAIDRNRVRLLTIWHRMEEAVWQVDSPETVPGMLDNLSAALAQGI
jgi:Phosphotransferase enzyme family